MMRTKNSILQFLRAEFLGNQSLFDRLFLVFGLLLQIGLYVWKPQSALAFATALCGICSVILCSQRKISTYLFGFAQVIMYFLLVRQQSLYAEMVQQIFYFVTMLFGLVCWIQHYEIADNSAKLLPRHLPIFILLFVTIILLMGSLACGYLLAKYTDDTQPYLDAFTTILAFAAQILMILAYREQWFLWLMVDIGLTVVWWKAGNYCLVVQHLFWCVNCVYGWCKWSK